MMQASSSCHLTAQILPPILLFIRGSFQANEADAPLSVAQESKADIRKGRRTSV